jgi:sugar lactone lactonase YvrE
MIDSVGRKRVCLRPLVLAITKFVLFSSVLPVAEAVAQSPSITSVSAVMAQQTQAITITGQGFGTLPAYIGNSPFILIDDATQGNWNAGHDQDGVGLNVTTWTDGQIVLAGFTGSYGSNGWALHSGDVLLLEVRNVQTGVGPAVCSVTVGAGSTNCAAAQGLGIITTIAGNGTSGYLGSGTPAAGAELNQPFGVALDGQGGYYIADAHNNMVRYVSSSGVISTVAGTGVGGYSGDGGMATNAELNLPTGVALDVAGNLFIADNVNCRIRMVSATTGIITTVAGNGICEFSGDGGAAVSASIWWPFSISLDTAGNVYIADYGNSRIRRVSKAGVISTIAGNGASSYSGDGGPALSAGLSLPTGVALDAAGNLYIADNANCRVRKVTTAGTISTIAGNGTLGFSGDGGPATAAELWYPGIVLVDASGEVIFSDAYNNRIRLIDSTGTITTIAGNGASRYSGDGGLATSAGMGYPTGISEDSQGNLYIADRLNSRIRKVSYHVPTAAAAAPVFSVPAGTYTTPQSVTLSDVTSGASIFYTTDGTTPTTSSTLYVGPISVNASETIQAVAVAAGSATSSVATVTYILNVPAVTQTVLTIAPASISPGNSVMVTVTVLRPGSGGTPEGSVLLTSGGFVVGTYQLSGGVVSAAVPIPAGAQPGIYAVVATYQGDGSDQMSSGSTSLTILPSTVTTLTISPGAVVPGNSVAVSVSVLRAGSLGTPVGSVVLSEGNLVIGTYPLTAGMASATIPIPVGAQPGTYTVTATYLGDCTDPPSAGNVNFTIKPQ